MNAPGVYTNIAKFKDFIESVILPGNCNNTRNVGIATSTAENNTGEKTPNTTAINTKSTTSARPNSEGSRTVLRNILIFFGERKFCFTLREVRTYGEHLRFIYKSAYLGDNY